MKRCLIEKRVQIFGFVEMEYSPALFGFCEIGFLFLTLLMHIFYYFSLNALEKFLIQFYLRYIINLWI